MYASLYMTDLFNFYSLYIPLANVINYAIFYRFWSGGGG